MDTVGHLLATSAIFVALFGIAWGLSWLLAGLDSLHSFPPEIFAIISKLEVWFIYGDAAVCGLVLLIGTGRFCIELMEVRNHA